MTLAEKSPIRVPALSWLRNYRRDDFSSDLLAGVIVAIMLVPQGMAYALLAGLPPEVGLYASIVPLIIYGVFGTSRTLAVGPVAIVSLMVASGIGSLANGDVALYLQLAVTLAIMVGVFQILLGLLRSGFLVNFLSHPVLTGFTAAAALLIGFSQVKHVLGYSVPRLEFFELLVYLGEHLGQTNFTTLAIGLGSVFTLVFFKVWAVPVLRRLPIADGLVVPLAKSGPLVIVLLGTLLVWAFGLHESAGVRIVGQVPAGLPPLTMPSFAPATLQGLLPAALAISFVGFMESISVAKTLASRRREKVDANQELVALGLANVGASFTGGYPVTGGLSRSMVNFAAGARTGLASIITAGLIAVTVLFLTPLFFFLPQAVLAAIILVAVAGLIDFEAIRHIWHYNKADAVSMAATFTAVLALGIELGILVGVGTAILLFVWRSSRPHTAIVGRLNETETYRNVERHTVTTWPSVVAVRIDESLYFANAKFLEDTVLQIVADRPEVDHFVLIGTAINFIDASALETLQGLHEELDEAGVTFHLAAIKGPVMDRLREIGFTERIGAENIHMSTHDCMRQLGVV